MAGEDHRLTTLRGVLASIHDEALAMLASPGLVRRARKDLESGESVAIEDQTADCVTVHVGQSVVSMPYTGPVTARCTCPSPGICRHILAATMFLQQHLAAGASGAQAAAPESASQPSAVSQPTSAPPQSPPGRARDELLAVTPEKLIKWAKTQAVREAAAMLEKDADLEIQEADSVVVTFRDVGIQCRYFAGATLEGMITNAPERTKYKYLAAAVLAFQRHHGVQFQVAGSARPKHTVSSSAAAVLELARALIADAMSIGLSHLSPTMRQRLDMLAVSAHGADLPRLASALRSLAEEIELLLDRHAQADEGRLFSMLGQTWALVEALSSCGGQPPP